MKKKMVSLLLALLTIISLTVPAGAAGTNTFQDVPQDHWANAYIERAYKEGAVNGTFYDESTGVRMYSPGSTLSLAHLVVMITRLMYPEEVASAQWEPIAATGLTGSEWYAKNYLVAYRHGLLQNVMYAYRNYGYPKTSHMSQAATRYQMAVLIANAMGAVGVFEDDTNDAYQATISQIADWDSVAAVTVSGVITSAVSKVYEYGVIRGIDAQGTFAGWNTVTRAQGAAIYCRFSDVVESALADRSWEKTGATCSGTYVGSYFPSKEPWEGRDGTVTAYIVEDAEELEGVIFEALQSCALTLMIYTRSDGVMEKMGTYSLAAPKYDFVELGYSLGSGWDEYGTYADRFGRNYMEYRLDISYDPFVYPYLYRIGELEEIPVFPYSSLDETGVTTYYERNYQPTLGALEEIENTYGVSMASSDYEKVRAIHRYLTKNFVYDYTYFGIIQGSDFSSTVRDYRKPYLEPTDVNLLLESGKGVCENFSATFRALCICFGVECYDAIGYANGAHSWNIVNVDGQWYHCDATWDLDNDGNFRYFLLSDSEMGRDHTLNTRDYTYPACPESYR